MKKHLLLLIKLTFTIGILAWILYSLDWHAFLQVFERVHGGVLVLAITLMVSGQLLSVQRWRILALALGLVASYPSMVRHQLTAAFLGQFLPGGVGMDVLRVWFFSRRLGEGSLLQAAFSVVAERASSVLGMSMMATLASWLVIDFLTPVWTLSLALLLAAGLLGWWSLPWLLRVLPRLWPPIARLATRDLLVYCRWRGPWWPSVLLAMLMHSLSSTCGLVIGWDLGFSLPVFYYFFMIPSVALVIAMPISLGGYGVREGGFIVLLGLVGVPLEDALAFALLFTFAAIWTPMIGGLVFLATRDHQDSLTLARMKRA